MAGPPEVQTPERVFCLKTWCPGETKSDKAGALSIPRVRPN